MDSGDRISVESIELADGAEQVNTVVSQQLVNQAGSFGSNWEGFEKDLYKTEEEYVRKHEEELREKGIEPFWWNVTNGKTGKVVKKQSERIAMKSFNPDRGDFYVKGKAKVRKCLPGAYTSAKGSIISAMKAGVTIEEGMSREKIRVAVKATKTETTPLTKCLKACDVLNSHYPNLSEEDRNIIHATLALPKGTI